MPPRVLRFAAAVVLLLAVPAWAEETYEVVFHPPWKAGDRLRIEAAGASRWSLEERSGTMPRPPLVREDALALEAEGEVVAVGADGSPTELRLRIVRLARTLVGREAVLVPAGTSVSASVTGGTPRYAVESASSEVGEALRLLLDPAFDGPTDQRRFAPDGRKRPGDGWTVRPEAVADALRVGGVSAPAGSVRGDVRLVRVEAVDGVACLVLSASFVADATGLPTKPGLTTTTSQVSSKVEATISLDPARPYAHHRCTRSLEVAAEGRAPGEAPASFRLLDSRTHELTMRPIPVIRPAPPAFAASPVLGSWVAPVGGGEAHITFRLDGTYGRRWPEGAALRRFRGTYELGASALRVEDAEEPGRLLTVPFRKLEADALELTIDGEPIRFARLAPAPPEIPPLAADPGQEAALRELEAHLAAGRAVDERDGEGRTRLERAARRGQAHLLARLLDAGADPGLVGPDGDTPLGSALAAGQDGAAALLVHRGAPLYLRDGLGFTPLHAVARAGSVELARRMLARGAAIDAGADDGSRALHVALRTARIDMVRLLLEEGADPRVRDHDGQTPLHVAAAVNLVPVLARLLAAGAELEARAKNGFRPLHEAAWAGKLDAVEFLVERGADLTARSELGTPEDVARRREHLDVAHRLMDLARARR